MKKLLFAGFLSLCMLICTACSDGNGGRLPMGNGGFNGYDIMQDANSVQQNNNNTQQYPDNNNAQQGDVYQQTPSGGWDWSGIPNLPSNSYITANGVNITDGYFYYTENTADSTQQFMGVFIYNGTTYALAAMIPNNIVQSGMALHNSDFTNGNGVMYYFDGYSNMLSDSYAGFSSADAHFALYNFSYGSSATFYIKLKMTVNGSNVDIEMAGESYYIDPNTVEQNSQDNGGGNGYTGNTGNTGGNTCVYCSGTGKCHICRGAGSTRDGLPFWGDPSLDDYAIVCSSCGGTGTCTYCSGTGVG